jgi:hypothetical protein
MPTTIYEDSLIRPDLFHWFGVVESELKPWISALPLRVHPGLVSFWQRTGGGVVFESETLLGPIVSDESDNVLQVSEFHWNKGMPRNLLIFHTGLFLSVSFVDWNRHQNRICTLRQGSYQIEQQFNTFDEWYQKTIRSIYAERYGLVIE